MSYELWKRLEEEEDGETKGRRPEIGHIFLLDRGELCSALLSSVHPRRHRNITNITDMVAQLESSIGVCECQH